MTFNAITGGASEIYHTPPDPVPTGRISLSGVREQRPDEVQISAEARNKLERADPALFQEARSGRRTQWPPPDSAGTLPAKLR